MHMSIFHSGCRLDGIESIMGMEADELYYMLGCIDRQEPCIQNG